MNDDDDRGDEYGDGVDEEERWGCDGVMRRWPLEMMKKMASVFYGEAWVVGLGVRRFWEEEEGV